MDKLFSQWSVSGYARLSIATAIFTIGLKTYGYFVTNSLALFADALESGINLMASIVMAWMLWLSAQPPDREHNFGHTKFEYFASGLEGLLILGASASIFLSGWERWHTPQPIHSEGLGTVIIALATAINGIVGLLLIRGGKRLRAIALEADGQHLLTDVWTSIGGMIGLGLVMLTGWTIFDSLAGLVVGINIAWTGIHLLQSSIAGLVDTALPEKEQKLIQSVLDKYKNQGIQFHGLLTRRAGRKSFIQIHVLVPAHWSVQEGHNFCEQIEQEIRSLLTYSHIITHLEPLEDPRSWADTDLL